MNKQFPPFILSVLLFLLLLTIFTYPVIFKITKYIYGPIYGTDNVAAVRDMWLMKCAFENKFDFYNNTFLNFPFGQFIKEYSLLPFWLRPRCLLSVLVNEIFAYNFLLLLSFILTFVCMYVLVFHLTRDHFAAFVSGIIFSLSPYHFNKTWEHYSLTFIDFFPFAILYLLKVTQNISYKNILIAAIFLLLVFIADLTYAYIMSIILFFYFMYRIYYNLRKKISFRESINFTINYLLLCFLAILLISPALFPVIKQMFFTSSTDAASPEIFIRPIKYLFTQSARPLSYLLPAAAHPIFGKFTKSMLGSIFYGRGSIEQTLYLGWVPIILAIVAYRRWRKNRKPQQANGDGFYIGFFIFSAILAFLFSMPPYFNLGLFKIYFPSFFMYKILPMFRAYARFGILVMLCVSVLAGYGLTFILERIKTPKKKLAFTALITCLVLFEFTNIPPFHVTDISNPPQVYQWLKGQPGDFAIAEYPLGESAGPGESSMPLDYLFYQRIHQKKLINGAQIGTYAYKVKQKINKIMAPETPRILKWLGAKYVVIHLDRYRTSEDSEAMDILGEIPDLSKQKGLKFVKKFDGAEVYEVMALPIEPKVD